MTTHKLSATALSCKDVVRFWSKVAKTESCWEWQAGCYPAGYGCFWFIGRGWGAHRISWLLHNGLIPEDLFVCHHCDNKLCVNPTHLFLGTLQDNNHDSFIKERRSRGTNRPTHKLTEEQVAEIRNTYKTGDSSYRWLAKAYTVTPNTIGQIIRKDTWNWL